MTVPLTNQDDIDRQKELSAKLNVLTQDQQERLARYRAEELGLPYTSLMVFPIDADILELIPRTKAQELGLVLFYKQGKDIRIGVVNPATEDIQPVLDELEKRYGAQPQIYVISHRSLASALARYRREQQAEVIPQNEIRVTQEEVSDLQKALTTLAELGKRITSLPPTEVLNTIVVAAVQVGSSDIHIEPKEKEARLRYRIDGVLQDVSAFDRQGWALVLSRIKVLSKLKLNVHEVPQDGSFVLKIGVETYDVRVSILPGGYGENIVMRILDRKSEAVSLSDLGMKARDYELVKEELKRTNGMVLVTGPTGSGKTTTLASFIREVNNPEIKIITLEDPIEYRLTGVQQTQVDVDAGYTFAKGLRSILRQDPDMILVGEMRDKETAETAVHAALTGHLVFTTLHTNNAPGAIPRLVDMGIKAFVLAPALNLVIAQRLVRVICKDCAKPYKPDVAEIEKIMNTMQGVRKDVFDPASLRKTDITFYEAVGCTACGSTGYRGRIGVFEMIQVDDAIKQLVLRGTDGQKILEAALEQGMTTIAQDAYLKVIAGVTTIAEVERISEE